MRRAAEETEMNEDIARRQGFTSLLEYRRLMQQIDISTQEKWLKFQEWQKGDGTKRGFMQLLRHMKK